MTTRKYMSEFGLNMFGSFCLLLQQRELEYVDTCGFGPNLPCHIYMITRRPRITLNKDSVMFSNNRVKGQFLIQQKDKFTPIDFDVPNYIGTDKLKLVCDYPYTEFMLLNENDEIVSAGKVALLMTQFGIDSSFLDLEVLYVGQSYGVEGARTAPSRLKNHSTLQQIYADAISSSPDQEIWLLLWSFEEHLLANFDGISKNYGTSLEEDSKHIRQVLRNPITEQQKINFTEAALIRYFEPEYNTTFKNNFPNPAHKTYSECYDIDLNMVCVELQTEEINARLYSPKVEPQWIHFAEFPLHSEEERRFMMKIFE